MVAPEVRTRAFDPRQIPTLSLGDPERESRIIGKKYDMNPYDPRWLLMEVFMEKGSPLLIVHDDPGQIISADRRMDMVELRKEVGPPATAVFCVDPIEAQRLRQLKDAITVMPEFILLSKAADGRHAHILDLFDDVADGLLKNKWVFYEIPNADKLQLTEQDRKQVRALAYEVAEHEVNLDLKDTQVSARARGEFREGHRREVSSLTRELGELRKKISRLDDDPISPKRMKEIISGLVERAEQSLDPRFRGC